MKPLVWRTQFTSFSAVDTKNTLHSFIFKAIKITAYNLILCQYFFTFKITQILSFFIEYYSYFLLSIVHFLLSIKVLFFTKNVFSSFLKTFWLSRYLKITNYQKTLQIQLEKSSCWRCSTTKSSRKLLHKASFLISVVKMLDICRWGSFLVTQRLSSVFGQITTLDKFHSFIWCLHCWLWTSKSGQGLQH